jgi:hypothetical protein
MAKDKDMSGQPGRAVAQESLTGVERMKPWEAEFKSLQGIENLKPQPPQTPPSQNPLQPQANAEDGQVSTDNDKSSK